MIIPSPFKPLWYLKNPHLQTLLANFMHPELPPLTRKTLQLEDGDTLELAYGRATGANRVLIVHGLEGSITSSYAQRLIYRLDQQNIAFVFMFFRGCNGKPNNKLRSYHSGDTGDIAAVINHLKQQGTRKIALVGYSLGGNVVLKYMGENKPDEVVVCASAISVPLLLADCSARMNRGFSRLYQFVLLKRLIKKVQQKRQRFLDANILTDPIKMKTFRTFDDTYTAPIHGFEDAQDYYHRSSARQFLPRINKPTLIIHAKDDPFMTTDVIPENDELSPQTTLELSEHGGHVGFLGGRWFKPEPWLEQRIIAFIQGHLD